MTVHKSTDLPLAARAQGLVGSVIDSSTSLLHKQSHDIVRFAMGSPAAEAIPAGILSGIAAVALGPDAPDAFDYGATEGDPPLRAALLDALAGTSDATTADRLMITAGGMQGLDLVCKLFVDPGDLVVVESPTYTNGSATALSYGAELLEVPVDGDGMVVELLPELVERIGRTPKAIYSIPTFQKTLGGPPFPCRGGTSCWSSRDGGDASSSTTTPTACCGSRESTCPPCASSVAATRWCSRSARSPRSSPPVCGSAGSTPLRSSTSC